MDNRNEKSGILINWAGDNWATFNASSTSGAIVNVSVVFSDESRTNEEYIEKLIESSKFNCIQQESETSPMDKDSVNINSTMNIADEESGNKKTVESGTNDQENIRFTSAFIGSSSGNINSTMHIADEESGNNKTVESEANDEGNTL
ncbi:hypothetical protein L2E82_39897 [Cichorium intybus]|uniref:Uncharacterized protein n=1 Tax=Cichorium intybus TaxID=13427 RepID=A0ACB9AKA4_CICIN|nr:hypothetical protein L2E82_39897 [Cichorium intybus]